MLARFCISSGDTCLVSLMLPRVLISSADTCSLFWIGDLAYFIKQLQVFSTYTANRAFGASSGTYFLFRNHTHASHVKQRRIFCLLAAMCAFCTKRYTCCLSQAKIIDSISSSDSFIVLRAFLAPFFLPHAWLQIWPEVMG